MPCNQIFQGREYIWTLIVVVVVIVIVAWSQNRIVWMITKLGECEHGIKEGPAGFDDYDNDHDNDNES